jgi:hypothetical protein
MTHATRRVSTTSRSAYPWKVSAKTSATPTTTSSPGHCRSNPSADNTFGERHLLRLVDQRMQPLVYGTFSRVAIQLLISLATQRDPAGSGCGSCLVTGADRPNRNRM